MRALPGLFLAALVLPVSAAGAPERVLEIVIGGPLLGPGLQDVPIESFVLPDWFHSAFVAVESRRTVNGGVFVLNELTIWSPRGEGSMVNRDMGGAGVYVCLDLVCEDTWADPPRSHTLANGPGEWSLEYRGATTAEYTLGVYAYR